MKDSQLNFVPHPILIFPTRLEFSVDKTVPSNFAQAMLRLICSLEISSSSLDWSTSYTD